MFFSINIFVKVVSFVYPCDIKRLRWPFDFRYYWSCGPWKINSCESYIWCSGNCYCKSLLESELFIKYSKKEDITIMFRLIYYPPAKMSWYVKMKSNVESYHHVLFMFSRPEKIVVEFKCASQKLVVMDTKCLKGN